MPNTRSEISFAEISEQLKELNDRVLKKSEFSEIIEEVRNGFKLMVEKIVEGLRAEFQKDLEEKTIIISNLSEKVVTQSRDIGFLNDKVAVVESAIHKIKEAQNQAEQYSRRHSLRLHGVPRKKGETAEDCLDTVRHIISELKLDIPDAVLDRAHRIGTAKGSHPPIIIFKFTTWRHRTLFYRSREAIFSKFKWKTTLDITRENIVLMDRVRGELKAREIDTIKYVFCDVNCQPTMRTVTDTFIRFNSVDQALDSIEKHLFPNPAERAVNIIEHINKSILEG